MKNERQHEDLIDLGAASVETKGPTFGKEDVSAGLIPQAGITNEGRASRARFRAGARFLLHGHAAQSPGQSPLVRML